MLSVALIVAGGWKNVIMALWGNDVDPENRSALRKACPSATASTSKRIFTLSVIKSVATK